MSFREEWSAETQQLPRTWSIGEHGVELALTESDGTGMPILMLHGTASSREAFARQFHSPLAEAHRLLALDLPGHGASGDAAGPAGYTLAALTETVAGCIAELKLRRLVICGWSLGGHIAMELIGHPAVAGVMITGAPPLSKGPLGMLRAFQPSWDMLLASKENFTERDVQRFYHLCFGQGGSPELLAAVRRATSLISRSTIPVLGYVKLQALRDRLVVSGTNLDCWLDTSFEAEAKGAILVPGKDLESALAVLPSGAQTIL